MKMDNYSYDELRGHYENGLIKNKLKDTANRWNLFLEYVNNGGLDDA